MHYPAGSKWLSSDSSGRRRDKFFIDHNGHRIEHQQSRNEPIESLENFELDVKSSRECLQRLSQSDMFSPLSDPLYRGDRKKGDSFSFTSVQANRTRK